MCEVKIKTLRWPRVSLASRRFQGLLKEESMVRNKRSYQVTWVSWGRGRGGGECRACCWNMIWSATLAQKRASKKPYLGVPAYLCWDHRSLVAVMKTPSLKGDCLSQIQLWHKDQSLCWVPAWSIWIMTKGDFRKGSTTFHSRTHRDDELWVWLIWVVKELCVNFVSQVLNEKASVVLGNVELGLSVHGTWAPFLLGNPQV